MSGMGPWRWRGEREGGVDCVSFGRLGGRLGDVGFERARIERSGLGNRSSDCSEQQKCACEKRFMQQDWDSKSQAGETQLRVSTIV